jgi:hypothetical protein
MIPNRRGEIKEFRLGPQQTDRQRKCLAKSRFSVYLMQLKRGPIVTREPFAVVQLR